MVTEVNKKIEGFPKVTQLISRFLDTIPGPCTFLNFFNNHRFMIHKKLQI